MNLTEVMADLKRRADPQTRKTWARHGCPEPFFGVKIGELKVMVKQIRRNTPLAKELYRTGNSDAMYLAGLIGHGAELTRAELQEWVKRAPWHMISEYTVPWMAAEHPEGWSLGLEWIESPDEKISGAGWNTLSGIVSTREDADLDLKAIEKLLNRVAKTLKAAPNKTRYTMNGFVIAVGGAVKPLTPKALEVAAKLGKVEVDVGDTECTVPDAAAYIRKVIDKGRHGKKRMTAKC